MRESFGAPWPNRGSDTPASDEVKRTGLQPQVGAEEIHTKQKEENDEVAAVDAGIEKFDRQINGGGRRVGEFRRRWQELKDEWQRIKLKDDGEGGLGDSDDSDYRKAMLQHPNMVPAAPQLPAGPGTFGNS